MPHLMMTSSNGNIFRVTGHLCGEFPSQRPVTRSFDVFFDLRLIKRLSKQSWGWWFETPPWSLWRQCNPFAILAHCSLNKMTTILYTFSYAHHRKISLCAWVQILRNFVASAPTNNKSALTYVLSWRLTKDTNDLNQWWPNPPLLLTWINFNSGMDDWLHPLCEGMELLIHRWSLGIDK